MGLVLGFPDIGAAPFRGEPERMTEDNVSQRWALPEPLFYQIWDQFVVNIKVVP